MIPDLLSKLLGANYKTTLTGWGTAVFSLLTMLSAAPYTLGDAATIIPPTWKAKLFMVGASSAFILRIWNAHLQKDRQVRGGVVDQDALGNIAKPQDSVAEPPNPTNT